MAAGEWRTYNGWIQIEGLECSITIEPRPGYCDRGNYVAKLQPRGRFVLEIDHQDGWPRYYFDLNRAKLEVEAWLIKRKQALWKSAEA